jgi:hypothetical protein
MEKKSKVFTKTKESKEINTIKTRLCPNCKEVIEFFRGQESKSCPSCGSLVLNIAS